MAGAYAQCRASMIYHAPLPSRRPGVRLGVINGAPPHTPSICALRPSGYAAAGALRAGQLLAFDYGLTREEFFTPERGRGTVRAYRRHQATADLLADPGEQDLTAQVNFSAVREAGEAAGLRTTTWVSQAKFLTTILGRILAARESFGEWGSAQNRQFQTLTHPEHLGRPFRVLGQSRP